MLFNDDQKSIIQSHFQQYGHVDVSNNVECEVFMFNLEQHLAGKDHSEELNCAESQLFYTLLSNNNIDSGYLKDLVMSFQEILSDVQRCNKK